jgi:hypothetical protein
MTKAPEGWITRITGGEHKYVVMVPEEGKEPTIKYFDHKEIFLPDEQEQYEERALLRGDNVVWLGVTGWTKPPKHYPSIYGTSSEEGIYESLVTALLMESIVALKQEGITVQLRHGVSDAGVDAAAIRVMETIPVSGSGVNCPLYMPWVADDTRGGPVLVAEDKEAYHKLYSQYHQILLVTGGREAAFHHDYLNRLKGDGFSVVADVMQTVSRDTIKALDQMPGQTEPQLNNAAAYVREKNSFTYAPIPRTFEELMATTKLTILDHAYKLLNKEPNTDLLGSLEEQVISWRRNRPHQIITVAELDHMIDLARETYEQNC